MYTLTAIATGRSMDCKVGRSCVPWLTVMLLTGPWGKGCIWSRQNGATVRCGQRQWYHWVTALSTVATLHATIEVLLIDKLLCIVQTPLTTHAAIIWGTSARCGITKAISSTPTRPLAVTKSSALSFWPDSGSQTCWPMSRYLSGR
jgi:hypothetical protein